MNLQQIGRKISALRKERDMTQNELAEKAGVSYQAVSSWERGLTMPDISKLPGISQILGVSIDDLLDNSNEVELIKDVLSQNTAVYASEKELHMDEIVEVAHVLKPSQVDSLVGYVEEDSMDLRELMGIAPFVSKEVLQQLAQKAKNDGDINTIHKLAPFLGKKYVDELAMEIEEVGGLSSLRKLAPFVSKDVLQQLVQKATNDGDINTVHMFTPFLGKEYIDQLAMEIEEIDGLGSLRKLAPFVSQDVLDKLVVKAMNRNNRDN